MLVSGAVTLEQVRAGLLSDGAVDAGLLALPEISRRWWNALPAEERQNLRGELRAEITAALDHFTQQPAGVGADVAEENPVSADSDGSQQPQGGGGGDAAVDSERTCPDERPDVAEGGSVQCGGVALAQLREGLRAEVARLRQDGSDAVEQEAYRLVENAADRLEALLTQQSSGGQEANPWRAKWLRQLAELIEETNEWRGAESDPHLLRNLAAEFESGGQEGEVEEGCKIDGGGPCSDAPDCGCQKEGR